MWQIFFQSAKRQIEYLEDPNGLRISIRVRRQDLLVYVFLVAWFLGWTVAGIKGISLLIDHTPSRVPLWPLGWIFGEIWVLALVLFLIGGREVVTITPDFVKCSRQRFGIGVTRQYFLHEVLNLRCGPPRYRRPGWLAFDYEGRTLELVSDITRPESVELLGRIRHKMSEYGAQPNGS